MTGTATSTAASGPAGAEFEGKVGAFYLLSMLTGTDPRGMPGTLIERIEMQRGDEGRPLDDVIVKATGTQGDAAVLEIQVKRSISFTPSDKVFRKVVTQIAETSRRTDFWETKYELAIATARTSKKIDGAYQDVLTWARKLGDPETFTARINRSGSANEDMRTFLRTFQEHLKEEGVDADDTAVWNLLRRLQILIFDFTALGSASEELVKERAIRALHTDETVRANALWAQLVAFAIDRAASGGDCDRGELVEHLRHQGFRLAGERRFHSARTALAEASRHALGDIDDRVSGFVLTRPAILSEVRSALETGGYVEIRGDAGVGKSAVLKHLAEQISAETQVIVLSPGRTTPRGWSEMRSVLGFDGTARELLTDLAGDGGSVLFIDNLDFFSDEEQRTVRDLVREGAGVPGLAVVATARRGFAVDEPNWLPEQSLDDLQRATPIVISELSDTEVEEIREAAPTLASLLADDHPARPIVRNLFRLARLSGASADQVTLCTEFDMAQSWWRTADGPQDGRRERARLLRFLAESALSTSDPIDVSAHPPQVVDELVMSETLRELRSDRVSFRHDVLREWAIANLLAEDLERIEGLPLDRPAPAALARGIELVARMALERVDGDNTWKSIVQQLSLEQGHGSWRRAALLALVRSENTEEALNRTRNSLFADRAELLRELIRTVMAVDVNTASTVWTTAGVDLPTIPSGLYVPSDASWWRLILWFLGLGESLPPAALPDVVDLYTSWSSGMLGQDPLTPLINRWLYRWLAEVESACYGRHCVSRAGLFQGELSQNQIRELESALRDGFLLFCNRTPELARQYLRTQLNREPDYQLSRYLLGFQGTLAQAAPAELAELIARLLDPGSESNVSDREGRDGPFGLLDLEFYPASAKKGPCWELLLHSPAHGLSLIRQLAEQAVNYYSRGRDPGDDRIIISLPDGERSFPWTRSYRWSRESAEHNGLAHGLLALEAWAHQRIDRGEPFDAVLNDVLGPPGTPAAFLLIAVDLILSHCPESRDAVIPFVACPELLCIDRERWVLDLSIPWESFGLASDSIGTRDNADSNRPPSRNRALYDLLSHYAFDSLADRRERLAHLLLLASQRLGTPDDKDTLAQPVFMAVHAMNLIDPRNYREVRQTQTDGTTRIAFQYEPPDEEARHLERLQTEAQAAQNDFDMENRIRLALNDGNNSSPEFAGEAAAWATTPHPDSLDRVSEERRTVDESIVSAAVIVMRDGDTALIDRSLEWALRVFTEALRGEEDPVHRVRAGLNFNLSAIAFVGLAYARKYHNDPAILRALLETAARDDPAASHGYRVVASLLDAIDVRIPRSILRCAFTACVRPATGWGPPNPETQKRLEPYHERVKAAVAQELDWLAGSYPEPEWPVFTENCPRGNQRSPIIVDDAVDFDPTGSSGDSSDRTDHQAAALWLSASQTLFEVQSRPWIRDVASAYAEWTMLANGQGLDAHAKTSHTLLEWNNAYFGLLARCTSRLSIEEIDDLALAPIKSLPDEPFLDVLTVFVPAVDEIYFNDGLIEEDVAVTIRRVLAGRLMVSTNWTWFARDRDFRVEMQLGTALSALFFNRFGYGQTSKCYLLAPAIDRLEAFLSVLENLIRGGPSLLTATLTLDLLEVSPRAQHLNLLLSATACWLDNYQRRSDFWIDRGIGNRVCALVECMRRQDDSPLANDAPLRSSLDRILSALVTEGVADARRLEDALTTRS